MLKLAGPNHTSDTIVLRAPRGAASLPVIRVVIGGVASRHALSVERLDDLELAVETLLGDEPAQGPDLVLSVSASADVFRIVLEGLRDQTLRRTLSAPDLGDLGRERGLDARMILDSLVDSYRTVDGGTADSFAVEMEKRIF